MAEIIKTSKAFLYMFRYAGENQSARIHMLKSLNPIQAKSFVELAVNSLYGVIPLSRAQKTSLKSIKSFILNLASPSISLKRKKLLLIKHHKAAHELVSILFDTLRQLIWHQE